MGRRERAWKDRRAEPEWETPTDAMVANGEYLDGDLMLAPSVSEPEVEAPADAMVTKGEYLDGDLMLVPPLSDLSGRSSCGACDELRRYLDEERQRRKALVAALIALVTEPDQGKSTSAAGGTKKVSAIELLAHEMTTWSDEL